MDRRNALRLLGVATATGAVLPTTTLTATEDSVHLTETPTPNENGRGFYWTQKYMGNNGPGQRMCAVLQDIAHTQTTVDGKRYWNPIVTLELSARPTAEEVRKIKHKLFVTLETYWAEPVPTSESWSTPPPIEDKIRATQRLI